ncbi:DUF4270 family protein [Ferruginibacter yonginensis]|uniref:DUF4270 family protein n=1 Tax=Ferruginibacter yonginensis TaxID=1310416 RepID=A0ABV8QNH7_9BACT
MQKRILPVSVMATFILIAFGISCTKIDTTSLGTDLVTVDNINTFADTLLVNATEGNFLDSTILNKAENHVVGNVSADPLFGTTTAAVYVQFKPTFYPFYFGNAGDTVYTSLSPRAGFDSAFICLSYKGTWGDSSIAAIQQTFEVRAIVDDNFREKTDTLRKLNYRPTVDPTLLGTATITPQIVRQKVILARGRDSVENQIRIKFNTTAGANYVGFMFNGQDSTAGGVNNGYYKDSIFRKKFNGFEIKAVGNGNTLYYVNIAEAKSRLEFHFHKTKAGVLDTVVQSFQLYATAGGSTAASSSANYIVRDYTGTNVLTPSNNDIYLQTAPSQTVANIKIPGLTNYPNRIIHRAYLIVEQDRISPTDDIYTVPPYLYLDLKDTATTIPQRYKPIYFDLNSTIAYNPDATTTPNALYHPFPVTNIETNRFGGIAMRRTDVLGNTFYRYEFNITRYVQHIASYGYKNYDLRVYAPFNYNYPQYNGVPYLIPFFNPIALGRVKVGSGTHPTHPMRLVIIYSKIP